MNKKRGRLITHDNTQIVQCPACKEDSPLCKLLYPCSLCVGKGQVSIDKATWWELGMRKKG